MTEAEWLSCTDPFKMVAFLGGKVSDRKLWLAACACCRRIPGFLAGDAGRNCLEVVERFADGGATAEELATLHEDGWDMRWYRNWPGSSLDRAIATYHDTRWGMPPAGATPEERAEAAGRALAEAADLLREVSGNPFRPATIIPLWLAWQACTVPKLVASIYEERQLPGGHLGPTRLAILADALEEAGCTDPAILGHLRQQGAVHVRGCWVVDLLTGRS